MSRLFAVSAGIEIVDPGRTRSRRSRSRHPVHSGPSILVQAEQRNFSSLRDTSSWVRSPAVRRCRPRTHSLRASGRGAASGAQGVVRRDCRFGADGVRCTDRVRPRACAHRARARERGTAQHRHRCRWRVEGLGPVFIRIEHIVRVLIGTGPRGTRARRPYPHATRLAGRAPPTPIVRRSATVRSASRALARAGVSAGKCPSTFLWLAAQLPPPPTRYWTMNERRPNGLTRNPNPVSSSSQTMYRRSRTLASAIMRVVKRALYSATRRLPPGMG